MTIIHRNHKCLLARSLEQHIYLSITLDTTKQIIKIGLVYTHILIYGTILGRRTRNSANTRLTFIVCRVNFLGEA